MSTRSKRSRSSRRSRRRVDFDTKSVASSSLSGFEPTPVQEPTQLPSQPSLTGYEAWRSLPDGRYNFVGGKWYKAPKPKYFWSPNNNMYEIIDGRLFQWPS